MLTCTSCGTENPDGFRFCGNCATPLPARPQKQDARKVVTALFCDVVGSTALAEELEDPEKLSELLRAYFDVIGATIERHGGTVRKYAGDSVLAVFGIPRVHEDDALRAVRASVEINQQLPALAQRTGTPLRFRTGVNTGLVLTDEGKSLALGDAVNVAARLEQAADPGEILLGPETLRLVRDAVEVEAVAPLHLKGKSVPFQAYRLVTLDPSRPGVVRRLDVPLVGRGAELALLRKAFERTVRGARCERFTVLGAAGVGKSRLAAELLDEAGGRATVLRGRCLPYGEGITFSPVTEALADAGAVSTAVRERLSSGGVAAPEELFLEVRRLLESLARERPVVLHLDDLQWAEPMLLDLIDHVTELSQDGPLLLLCTARAELVEHRPEWVTVRPNASRLELEPLGTAECEALFDQLDDELDAESRARVITASDGNPLFLGEMVAFARESGSVTIPPTIQALLSARLEGLAPEEREPLERGAVEGEVFHRSAVAALLGRQEGRELEARLQRLVRKDLIRPHPSSVAGDDAFRFRHLLIRDAAYERLPKGTRSELHLRFAQWLESASAALVEVDELAGWHLEQSVRHQRDLGRPGDPAVARRASAHLYSAGVRASGRSDLVATRNLLQRALELVPERTLAAPIAAALAEQLIEVGDLGRADALLRTAEQDQPHAAPSLTRLEWRVRAEPGKASTMVESALPRLLRELASAGDERGIAKAHMLAFWVHWTANRATAASEQAKLAADHARAGGDEGLWSRALGWYVATLIYGPYDADTIADETAAIGREQMGPYLRGCVDLGRGEVERLRARFDAARELTEQALDGFRALGIRTMAANCEQSLARIELTRGDEEAALAPLLRADAMLAEFSELPLRSTTQAMLAKTYELLGDTEAATFATNLAEELSAPQDVINFAITHEVRARLALAAGEREAAERWARSAVDHAFVTEFVDFQAEARLGLAQVLAACDRGEDASAESRAAHELFARKGDLPGGQAAGAVLTALGVRA
jgi:class 3 adenylate cyclase/tetratricopeptide (TPR) repeat protein